MNPHVYNRLEKIITNRNCSGRALALGTRPDDRSILACDALSGYDRVGININVHGQGPGFEVLEDDARDMDFADNQFGVIVANAILEHVPDFWKVIEEIYRVAQDGATIIIGVPGYTKGEFPIGILGKTRLNRIAERIQSQLVERDDDYHVSTERTSKNEKVSSDSRILLAIHDILAGGYQKIEQNLGDASKATLTFPIHGKDYYRFTPRAVEEVFLSECENTSVEEILTPPRILGVGEYYK